METLSEMTRNNMANYPDFWPTVMCYRELLAAACRKFGCKPDEAREKYGRLTNVEWSELLAAKFAPQSTQAAKTIKCTAPTRKRAQRANK